MPLQNPLQIQDEGVDQGVASILNLAGAGVSGAVVAGVATATVPGAAGSSTFLQSVASEITVDTTTTSTTFVTLLTRTITIVAGSVLLVWFTETNSQSSGSQTTFFRLQVDGVTQKSAGTRSPAVGDPQGIGIVQRVTGLAAGLRTVTIHWRVTGGTSRIRPVAVPDAEPASLVVAEVTV